MGRVTTTAASGPAVRGLALSLLVAIACLGVGGAAARADEPTIQQRVETAAQDLPFFDWGDFLYDRLDERCLPLHTPPEVRGRYREILGGLLDAWRKQRGNPLTGGRDGPEPSVVQLLKSADARVRTLAMALLFDREDPKWLPLIAERTKDGATTFPVPVALHLVGGRPHPPLTTAPETVGSIATSMIQFWTGSVEFGPWWEARRDRPWSIACLAARYKRALAGTSSPAPERLGRAHLLLETVERWPSPGREVALLCVFAPERGASEVELVRAARRLGPDRCLQILRGQAVTDDADEVANHHGPQRFILDHATDLLRPSDRGVLIGLAREAKDMLGRWYAAAAHLDPSKASETIDEGWGRLQDRRDLTERSHLAWEGWTILGRPRIPFVVDWLHSLRPTDYDYADLAFLQRLLDRWTPDDRALIATYVRDARLDTLRGEWLVRLVDALERNLPEPAVPAALRALVTSFPPNEKDPAVADALAEWRKAIRESVPRWALAQ